MKRLNVDIPTELHRQVKIAAMYEDVTVSSLVQQLLRAYLQARDQSPRPRHRASDPPKLHALDSEALSSTA